MQTTTPDGSPAPATPQPAPAPSTGTNVKPTAVPKTLGIEQLITRRQELSSQLTSVTERRNEVASDLANTPNALAQTGLQERLQVLDKQIIQLETDLAATSTAIAASPGQLMGSSEAPNYPTQPDNFEDGLVIGWLTAGLPLLIILFVLRRRWRRGAQPAPLAAVASDSRIDRLESGIEAIAIEIERVSEGQRFVTKLLSESPNHLKPILTEADKETNRQPVEAVATSLPKRES